MPLDEMSVDDLAAEAARLGYTPAQIVAALEARIACDQAYLRRRRQRGTATPTDEAMLRDLPILAAVARARPHVASSGRTTIKPLVGHSTQGRACHFPVWENHRRDKTITEACCWFRSLHRFPYAR